MKARGVWAQLVELLARPGLYLSPRVDVAAIDPERMRRLRMVTAVTVLVAGIGVPFVVQYWRLGIEWMSISVGLTIAAAVGTLWFLRMTARERAAGWMGVSMLLVLLFLSNCASGGFYDPNFAWFYVIPILAALLVDARAGWIFTAIVLLLTVAFWVAPSFGVVVPDLVPPEMHEGQSLANRMSAVFAIGVSLAAIASHRSLSAKLLRRANDELRAEMDRRGEAQVRLVHAERMASMGTLAAGVAHEINNPLTYVTVNLELLRQRIAKAGLSPDDKVALERLLVEAAEGTARVRDMVEDLRTFSRDDDAGRGPVDVGRPLGLAIRMAKNEIRHRARLTRTISGDLPPVRAEEGKLVQVFLNLLTNAAHSIEDGYAEDNEIRVSVDRVGDDVQVRVVDTGQGIVEESLERVFEPFYTTKGIGEGTGLGLTISRNIIRQLGGDLVLESAPGEGTAVTVRLPVAVEVAEPAEPPSGLREILPATRLRVLVVDDEMPILRAVRRVLSHHDVVVTTSAQEALDLCANDLYDVVLCDLMMPQLSGADFYEELLRLRPDYEGRLLFMTGGVFTPRMTEFLASQRHAVIKKPFDVRHLQRAIDAFAAEGETGERLGSAG